MSTIERLFVQIFDRKSRIELQLRQQFESYGESLALNVIADGGQPPPWLWEMDRSTVCCPDPRGLNKEQLISGICFPVPLGNAVADPCTSFTISEVKDGNVCKPVRLFREVSKEVTAVNKQNCSKAVETKVVEGCSEPEDLHGISDSKSSQREVESNVSKKAKITNIQGEDVNSNKRTSRTIRSSATSKKNNCQKGSFAANVCEDMHTGCGGRVTRSKSRLLTEVLSSDKLAGDNFFNQDKDIANQPTERQSIATECLSDKLQCVKSSILSDTISFFEQKKVIEVHGCQENEHTSVEFSMENQIHQRENAPSRLEATQLEPDKSISRHIMAMHCSPHQHIQEGDMLHDVADISVMEDDSSRGGIEEGKAVDDLECRPDFPSNCKLPGQTFTSPVFFSTTSGLLNSFEDILDKQVVSTVTTEENNSPSYSREEQLCEQLKNPSEGDAILWHDEDNPLFDGEDLQFHELKGSACGMQSDTGLDVISKCACSHVFSGNADSFHSLTEGSLCNVHAPLLDIQPLEGNNLATVASLIGKKVDIFPVECQGERQEISEVADPSYNTGPAPNFYKPSNTHMVSFSELGSESCRRDSSSQFTYCLVCCSLGCSCNHISMLNIGGDFSSKRSLKCQTESNLEVQKERCGHSVHGCKSCLTAFSPEQERGLQKVQSETSTTEAVSRSLNFSAEIPVTAWPNDASTPDEHSSGTIDDDSMFLKADKVAICPVAAEKSITEKVLTSADGESYSIPSLSLFCLKSSTAHKIICNSYSSGGAICVNESKQHIEVSGCEYANSWPKRKEIKYKSSNVIATARSGTRSFLDINQQSECKYKIVTVSEDANSSPKLSEIQIPTAAPCVALQNNELHDLEEVFDCNSNNHDLLISPNMDIQIKAFQAFERDLSVCSRDEVVRPTNLMPSEAEIHHTSWGIESLFSDVDAFENNISVSPAHCVVFKEPNDAERYFYRCDITSTSDTAGVKSNYDKDMPIFEGFNIDHPYRLEDNIVCKDVDIPSIAKERAFVIEQLCLSSIFPTPNSKTYVTNKIDTVSDGFQTSPLGILESINLGFSIEHNNPDINHFSASTSINLMDISCNIASQFDSTTLERSHSLSSSFAWLGSEPKNPPLTPVRKFSHGRLSGKRNSSSVTVNSIPDLICFRIDENSSTTEEDADFVQVGYASRRTSSRNVEVLSNSKPLSDVTALYQKNTGSLTNLREFVVRDSLDSINSGAASSLGFEFVSSESKTDNKENPRHMDSIQKLQKAARTKSKLSELSSLSCKSSESIGNHQNIRKPCKPSNILSSVSSFVPLLQRKQGAPSLQGMKDIKVKALETAEAAKRLEDQKKMEREKKKAEAKLVREKIKQENAKQLILKQKQKEEERRKKEEDVAARKRQREEEERKVKERKRRCIEEMRTLQREHEDKYYEKDQKDLCQKDEKLKKGNRRICKGQNKLEKGGVYRNQMDVEVQHGTVQALKSSNEHNYEKGVGCSNDLREASEETTSSTQISIDLLSYDMSPYQNSDDEDREDGRRKKKYIPLWARRESLGEIILSNQHLDPKEIFSRKRSFDINQVLSAQVPFHR